eukprot:scaffold159049_cov27-Tisochrysis_lutea.AAC.3
MIARSSVRFHALAFITQSLDIDESVATQEVSTPQVVCPHKAHALLRKPSSRLHSCKDVESCPHSLAFPADG